jgi:hypothetical protein
MTNKKRSERVKERLTIINEKHHIVDSLKGIRN